MARLKVYTVHINPSLAHPYEYAEFVQEGFSFRAFVFSTLWAVYFRLWGMAALLLAYNLCIFTLFSAHAMPHTALAIMDVGVHLIIGFEANDWLRAKLKKQGYLTSDIATGESMLRAEQRYFDRYFSGAGVPA